MRALWRDLTDAPGALSGGPQPARTAPSRSLVTGARRGAGSSSRRALPPSACPPAPCSCPEAARQHLVRWISKVRGWPYRIVSCLWRAWDIVSSVCCRQSHCLLIGAARRQRSSAGQLRYSRCRPLRDGWRIILLCGCCWSRLCRWKKPLMPSPIDISPSQTKLAGPSCLHQLHLDLEALCCSLTGQQASTHLRMCPSRCYKPTDERMRVAGPAVRSRTRKHDSQEPA